MRFAKVSMVTARRRDMSRRKTGSMRTPVLLHAEEDGDEREVDGAVDVHERGGEGGIGGDRA